MDNSQRLLLRTLRAHFSPLLVACFTGSIIFSNLPAKPITVSNAASGSGLQVLTVDSPAFQSGLHVLLSQEAIAKATPILPYSLILVNESGKYIWSFTVIYTYKNRISNAGTPWKFVVTLTANSADRTRLLAPGAQYFVSPGSDFLASTNPSGGRTLQPLLDEGMDRIIEQFITSDGSEVMDVSIESVIYEDGALLGPDTLHRLESVNDQAKADEKLFNAIDGLQGEPLKAALTAQAQQGLARKDPYGRRQLEQARALMNYYDQYGSDATLRLKVKIQSTKRFSGANQQVRRQ